MGGGGDRRVVVDVHPDGGARVVCGGGRRGFGVEMEEEPWFEGVEMRERGRDGAFPAT